MTNAFLYKWTHIPTLRWYVGSRTAKGCHPNDGYICSSKKVKPMILENKEEWRREIIAIGDSSEILDLESEVLQFNEETLNILRNQKLGDKNPNFGKTPWNKKITKETV